jgi:DNA-binding NarL/FixJ family response regulator
MRVLIVDDHDAVRRSLSQALREEPDMEVVGEASNGEEATQLAEQLNPDVVLMDIAMPRIDGIEATRRITRDKPQIRIIGLSIHDSMAYASRIIDAAVVPIC